MQTNKEKCLFLLVFIFIVFILKRFFLKNPDIIFNALYVADNK